MIRRQLRLEPAAIAHERWRHDAALFTSMCRGRPDATKRPANASIDAGFEQIEPVDLDASDACEGRARRLDRSRTDDHRRSWVHVVEPFDEWRSR